MTRATQNHYEVLGVARSATSDQIKTAYRKLARLYHPDTLQTLHPSRVSEAEERFKNITWAYSVLSDVQKRQTYDNQPIFVHEEARASYQPRTTYYSRPAYQPPAPPVDHDQIHLSWKKLIWNVIITIPFMMSNLLLAVYRKVGFLLFVGLVVYWAWLVLSGQMSALVMFRFLLATDHHPEVGNGVPLLGALIGVIVGAVSTVILAVTHVLSRPASIAKNPTYLRNLAKLTKNHFIVSVFVGAAVGFWIARVFF